MMVVDVMKQSKKRSRVELRELKTYPPPITTLGGGGLNYIGFL